MTQTPQEIKPIENINHTFANVDRLVTRIEALVERLVSLPQEDSSEGEMKGLPVGSLNAIIHRSSRINERISDANQALDALEKLI